MTLVALVALVTARVEAHGGEQEQTASESRRVRPLTESEALFWDLASFEDAMVAYNEALTFIIEGALDIEASRRALQAVVERHAILRTAFRDVDGVPTAEELPYERLGRAADIQVEDLSDRPDPLRACEAMLQRERQRPFDLATPPLFRVALWKIGADRWLASCVLYHIVADSWAVARMCCEIAAEYDAAVRGGAHRDPPLDESRETLEIRAEDEDYWRQCLATPPSALQLSTRPRPAIKQYRGGTVRRQLTLAPGDLHQTAARLGITPASLTCAAFCILLRIWSGQREVTVGVPFVGRDRVELQRAVGVFLNALPFSIEVPDATTVGAFAQECHRALTRMYRHRRYPARRLASLLGTPSLSRNPLFEHLFSYLDRPPATREEHGLIATEVELDSGTAKFDLSVFLTCRPDRLDCKAEFALSTLSGDEVSLLSEAYDVLLGLAVHHPDRVIESALALVAAR